MMNGSPMTLLDILIPWVSLHRLRKDHAELSEKYRKLTDRDERGRFRK